MKEKLFEVDFKVDGKVVDTIKLQDFKLGTIYEDDVKSYTSTYLKVGNKHLNIWVAIETLKSIARELGWWNHP